MIDWLLKSLFRPTVRVQWGPIPVGGIYRRVELTIVVAVRLDPDGFPYPATPLHRIAHADARQIGEALYDVLRSKPEKWMKVPDYNITNRLVPEAFGVASWRAALERCTYVEMRRLRKRLLFVPTKIVEVDDDERSFAYLLNQASETTVSGDPRNVGEAAMRALERSS